MLALLKCVVNSHLFILLVILVSDYSHKLLKELWVVHETVVASFLDMQVLKLICLSNYSFL